MLPAGHAVNEIVQHDDRDVDVAAAGVDEVVPPDGRSVAVAADDEDFLVRPCHLQPRREGQRAAVRRVQRVPVDIPRETGRASDPGDERDVVLGDLQRVDGPEERLEDDPVGAAGAPDVGQLPGPDVLIVIEGHYRTSLIFSRIWAGVMGSPSTRKMPSTLQRPFAHRSTSWTICPSDSSGTMIPLTREASAATSSSGNGQMVSGRRSPALIPAARASSTAFLPERPDTPYANTATSASSSVTVSLRMMSFLFPSTFRMSRSSSVWIRGEAFTGNPSEAWFRPVMCCRYPLKKSATGGTSPLVSSNGLYSDV